MLGSVASLALVVGLLAGLLWWLRRASWRRAGSGRLLQVVETVPLGPDRFLHLVKLGDRGLVVASAPGRCELICEVESGTWAAGSGH